MSDKTYAYHDKCGIYKIACEADGSFYIGSSQAIYRRWYVHRVGLRSGKHHCSKLLHRWQKHGESAFRFEVIEECDYSLLLAREKHWIDELKPQLNMNPYRVTRVMAIRRDPRVRPRLKNLTKAAKAIGVHPVTLRRWCKENVGPPSLRIGKRHYWSVEILKQWMVSRSLISL